MSKVSNDQMEMEARELIARLQELKAQMEGRGGWGAERLVAHWDREREAKCAPYFGATEDEELYSLHLRTSAELAARGLPMPHYHQAKYSDEILIDACNLCGLDLRSLAHHRAW